MIHCTEEKTDDMVIGEIFAPVKERVKHIHCNSVNLWGKMIGTRYPDGSPVMCCNNPAKFSLHKPKVFLFIDLLHTDHRCIVEQLAGNPFNRLSPYIYQCD